MCISVQAENEIRLIASILLYAVISFGFSYGNTIWLYLHFQHNKGIFNSTLLLSPTNPGLLFFYFKIINIY